MSFTIRKIVYLKTKLILTNIVILSVFIVFPIKSQTNGSLEKFIQINNSLPREKIFLHLDRPNYIQGDTIWFKAYIWFGYNQNPDTISKVLHVDLLNSAGKIEQSRKTYIQGGTSFGEFCLEKNLLPGTYSIRAYTRWMQNENTGDPYYQTVTISPCAQDFLVECNPVIKKQTGNDSLFVFLNFFQIGRSGDLNNNFSHKVNYSLKINDRVLDTGIFSAIPSNSHALRYNLLKIKTSDTIASFEMSIQDNQLSFRKKFEIPLQEGIDVQFFPEGGDLVNNLPGKVAFKVIGTDGLSREVIGTIETESGTYITSFKSTHKGMGCFTLKPEFRRKYFAHIWFDNRNYIIPLPTAKEKGSVIAVNFDNITNNINLTLRYSQSDVNHQKYVVASAYGKILFITPLKTIEDSCLIQIPFNILHTGITRLTVLDSSFVPECERLVYTDFNQQFKVSIHPDSSSYGPRSKVSLLITTRGNDGLPAQTDLSLAVVDKDQILQKLNSGNISVFKLLESELQGNIEDAEYYFENDSCKQKDLDLVLLTHGYRRFLNSGTEAPEPEFMPERSYNISGKIKKSGNDNRFDYHKVNLILLCSSDKPLLDLSNPDSLGNFNFNIPLQEGRPNSIIQASHPNGRPLNCDILINDDKIPPRFIRPFTPQYNSISPSIEYIKQLQTTKKTEISKAPWEGAMSSTLGEVVITARAKNWYHDLEKVALKTVDLDSIDPKGDKYESIYDLLEQQFGAKKINISWIPLETVFLPSLSVMGGVSEFFPIYVINGKTFWNGENMNLQPLTNLSALKVNQIKKVMVLPPKNEINHYYASMDFIYKTHIYQSLVNIETYTDTFRGDPKGIKSFIIDGLDVPRSFYSPRYEDISRNSLHFDGRATIFWNPSIKTDQNGQAHVEFYTSDTRSEMDVVINGIQTFSGIPGHTNMSISPSRRK
jgi:hypothetical protein